MSSYSSFNSLWVRTVRIPSETYVVGSRVLVPHESRFPRKEQRWNPMIGDGNDGRR
jgi:hypothetical protein